MWRDHMCNTHKLKKKLNTTKEDNYWGTSVFSFQYQIVTPPSVSSNILLGILLLTSLNYVLPIHVRNMNNNYNNYITFDLWADITSCMGTTLLVRPRICRASAVFKKPGSESLFMVTSPWYMNFTRACSSSNLTSLRITIGCGCSLSWNNSCNEEKHN